MIPNIFILDTNGEVLMEKHYAPGFKRSVCDVFWEEAGKHESKEHIPPVINTAKYYLVHIFRHSLFIVTAVASETEPLLILELQQRLMHTIVTYLGEPLTPSVLRKNFFPIFELLDELIDGGFPLTTELNSLTDMITPPTIMGKVMASLTDNSGVTAKLPECTTSRIPWRKADADYMNNEVYFDFHERVDAILDANEQVISAEIFGEVQTTCHLSGVPDMLLTFARSSVLDDVHLHRCVRLQRFEKERVVSFVPPDGAFTLMTYRVDGFKHMPISVRPSVSVIGSTGKVHIAVAPRYNERKPVEELVLTLPLPKCTLSTALSASGGAIKYDETRKCVRWEIGFLPEGKQQVLEGTFELPAAYVHEELSVVTADFNIKMFALSGLKVDGLTITNVKYKPFKGFRTVTKAGTFQIRCT